MHKHKRGMCVYKHIHVHRCVGVYMRADGKKPRIKPLYHRAGKSTAPGVEEKGVKGPHVTMGLKARRLVFIAQLCH